MAAPEYVPNTREQQPRRGLGLPPARSWTATRVSDLKAEQPTGKMLGNPGPDQGYGLKLAKSFADRLVLDGVSADDAVAGCLGVGLHRAALFGRAPVIHDLHIAVTIWGFVDPAPPAELVALRRPLFEGAAEPEHYASVRQIVDMVPDATLAMTPADVQAAYPERWRDLVGTT